MLTQQALWPAQGPMGAFDPPLDLEDAAALGALLATERAADALCAAAQGGAPGFGRPLADALCGLAARLQARWLQTLQVPTSKVIWSALKFKPNQTIGGCAVWRGSGFGSGFDFGPCD